jgi:ribosomal protein S18 acetylase RimI-like enzyme
MNPIVIRPANSADVDTLNRFQQGIVAAERPFDPTIKAGPVQYYDTAQMLASDQVQFVVAESGSQIIGCGFARIETAKHYLAHSHRGYLGMMYVDPKYRGQSVSKRIIDALKDWCLSKNVTELRLEVYHDNHSAVKAYEKSGFRSLMTEMRLSLNEEDCRKKPQ